MKQNNLLLVIGAVAILVFTGYNLWNASGASADLQNVVFTPLVKGCAETESGMLTRSVGQGTEAAPSMTVNGNEIVYYEALNHQCCRAAKFDKNIQGNIISIYEKWSGDGCRCMCFSELSAKLSNVPSGSYTVNVYSDETNEPNLVLSQNITIE